MVCFAADLGTYIDSGTVFIAGAFTGLADKAGMLAPGSNVSSGRLQRSHLARVPSKLAVRVANASAVGCALDLERATYYRRSSISTGAAAVTIEQRWYAHKMHKALLVMEMDTVSTAAATLALSLDQEHSSSVKLPPSYIDSPPEDDVAWAAAPIPGCPEDLWCQLGNTTTPDVPTTPPTTIAYVSTRIPPTLAVPAGKQSRVFLAAARSTHVSAAPLTDALAAHKAATGSPGSSLLQSHRAAWLDTWSQSIIEFEGDDFVQRAINATLYIILSGHDETFSTGFPVSMEGLVEGAFGHWGGSVLWDADYWIYPAISMFRPSFQRDILQYRYNTMDQARLSATQYGNRGAKFSWESASSGAEVSSGPGCSGKGFPCSAGVGPWNGCGVREIHIGADIVVTARRHWWQTRNLTWLREVGQPIAAAVADYYCSRTTASAALGATGGSRDRDRDRDSADQLSIAGVLGPDEHDDNVTDSTYTNAAAIAAIEFAVESSEALNLTVDPLWRNTANRLHIPFDATLNIHPEFVGMATKGFQGKQADTVML